MISIGCADREPDAAHEPKGEIAQTNPLIGAAAMEADERSFEGIVRERLPASGYVYLRLQTDGRQRWVATMGRGPAPGTAVHVRGIATREDFHSRRLDRRFERLVFGIVETRS